MKLTMLGTGKALVTECYNTCFLIEDKGHLFMTDGGGGNTVLRQIKHAGYNWMDIHHIFVTHKHTDHVKLDKAVDALRSKFGADIIQRGTVMKDGLQVARKFKGKQASEQEKT